jgi:hypothetical protein
MFVVSEEAAAAIRTVYEQEGELSAAIEVRRLFPGITDNAKARECARTIAGWKPLPAAVCQITRLRPPPGGRSSFCRAGGRPGQSQGTSGKQRLSSSLPWAQQGWQRTRDRRRPGWIVGDAHRPCLA